MKRVLITRPRAQADAFALGLKTAGFEPVFFPVIEIRPMDDNRQLDRALCRLDKYDWVVFTSTNGVDVVLGRLPANGTEDMRSFPRVAAIGPKTSEALRDHGITPDFVPGEYVAEAILPGLGDLSEKWVLLPRAEIARKALPEAIAAAGGIAHEIAVYRTLPAHPDFESLAALCSGVDIITLTSPSAVQNFIAILRQNELDPLDLPGHPRFACIGPITAAAAREEGLVDLLVASEYTTAGLVQLIGNLKDE